MTPVATITDPSVVAIRTSDGTVIADTELLARRTVESYSLPPDLYDPILAWIETHGNQVPSAHDAKALWKRVEQSAPDVVTHAIRLMGNAGGKSINTLDTHLRPLANEWRRREAQTMTPHGATPRGDA